jgi:hypothetical protein
MSTEQESSPTATAPTARPWQFGLRQLLLAMAAASIMCAAMFTFPDAMASIFLMMLMLALPTFLISGLVYGSGSMRAFCLGALVPTSAQLFTLVLTISFLAILNFESEQVDLGQYLERTARLFRTMSLATWVAATVCGVLAIAVKDMLERMDLGK